MAVLFVDATTGTNTAALPSGTQSGDIVVAIAYRNASATSPTLPTNWTNIVARSVTPAIRGQYRVYDGVWTMPTFTNATRVHALTLRGHHPTSPLTNNIFTGGATNQTITWPAQTITLPDRSAMIIKGAVHARPDVVIPAPTGHTSREAEGTQPGQITVTQDVSDSWAVATSATSRSDVYSYIQFEIRAYPFAGWGTPI